MYMRSSRCNTGTLANASLSQRTDVLHIETYTKKSVVARSGMFGRQGQVMVLIRALCISQQLHLHG